MKSRSSFFIIVSILSLLGYGFFVFAAPPGPGGYTPGETLDPECTPGQLVPEPCIVKLPLTTADNGLTVTGSNVQLGGTLLQNTLIDQDGNDFSLINGNLGYQNNSNIAGIGIPGAGVTYQDSEITSLVGIPDQGGWQKYPVMYFHFDDGINSLTRTVSLGDVGIQISNQINGENSNLLLNSSGLILGYYNNNINNYAEININGHSNNNDSIQFQTDEGGYTFPRGDGSSGQVLTTDGLGQLTWETVGAGGSDWSLTGNSGTTAGTNFLGTTDAQDFMIKTGGAQVALFGQNGNISLGSAVGMNPPPVASGVHSFAAGAGTTASGDYSAVLGNASVASGDASMALGYNVTTHSFGELALGTYSKVYTPVSTTSWELADRLIGIGNGNGIIGNRNAYTLWKDGSFAYNDDNFQNDTPGTEQNTFYFNYGNHDGLGVAQTKRAIRLGSALNDESDITSANVGDRSIAIGFQDENFLFAGSGSFAFAGPIASGDDSFAIGTGAVSSGGYSMAVGHGAQATNTNAHAFGFASVASGIQSTAIGPLATASGEGSTAIGVFANAVGDGSLSVGNGFAFAQNSMSYGLGNAYSLGETNIGMRNTSYTPIDTVSWNLADRLFTIGGGDASNISPYPNAADVFTILKNGKTGIGYDNFETTAFDSLLQVDGAILSSALSGSCTSLASDANGKIVCGGGSGWSLTGNSGTTPGTNFLGTIDNKDLMFKTNNVQTGLISDDGLSIQFGSGAGSGSAAQSYTTYIGVNSGFGATGTSFSNFIGASSGYQATNVSHSNFLGSAGFAATNADHSNFFGNQAGYQAVNASNSNFFGNQAGYQDGFIGAPVVNNSNFFGQEAGKFATNSSYSNFFGYRTGNGATNAANSIFIGSNAGYGDTVDNTTDPDDYSILIGNNSGTNGYENSVALGAYATNTSSNQFMIGSATRPINTLVLTGASGNTCVLDVTVASPSCSSDETLKMNITDLDDKTLESLIKVKTVSYNWKNYPTKGMQIGFLAQDLEQYFPEVVSVAPNGFKTVSYGGMTPILTKAIQEMNLNMTQITDMTRENTWRDALIEWLGTATNGITKLFAGEVHTDTLCVGQTCVTESQLQQLLQDQNIVPIIPTQTPPGEEIDNTDPIIDIIDTGNFDQESPVEESVVDTSNNDETPAPVVDTPTE